MKVLAAAVLVLLAVGLTAEPAGAVRLKEMVRVKGVRSNPLHGFGLVTGLSGSGDGDQISGLMASHMVLATLNWEKMALLKSKNIALVSVTAEYPAFGQPGDLVDVKVAAVGNAKSLKGGVLQDTFLYGPGRADKTIYAIARGPLLIGADRNQKTVGEIPNGAILEAKVKTNFLDKNGRRLTLILNKFDFTTASNVAQAVNSERLILGLDEEDGLGIAFARSAASVDVVVPDSFQGREVDFLSRLLQIDVEVDTKGKVVINERTGVVAIGADVTILPVALTVKGVTITIQPRPGSPDPPKVGSSFRMNVQAGKDRTGKDRGAPLQQLVDALNQLQIKTDELIAIIQTLKKAGVLVGEVVIM